MQREALTTLLDGWLEPQRFKDYGPNGLQVQGRESLSTVVTGVTASLALIEAAVAHQADGIVVHHGLFWRGQDGRVVGWMRERLGLLIAHNINLWAYHLPLDAHPVCGNNAQLARVLGFETAGQFGDQDLGFWGQPGVALGELSAEQLVCHAEQCLQRKPVAVLPDPKRRIRRVAWCTGGAQSYFEAAIALGVDAYITGEISEPQAHYARESGVAYLACGHHATERYGVLALGHQLAQEHGLTHIPIDIDNPA